MVTKNRGEGHRKYKEQRPVNEQHVNVTSKRKKRKKKKRPPSRKVGNKKEQFTKKGKQKKIAKKQWEKGIELSS